MPQPSRLLRCIPLDIRRVPYLRVLAQFTITPSNDASTVKLIASRQIHSPLSAGRREGQGVVQTGYTGYTFAKHIGNR